MRLRLRSQSPGRPGVGVGGGAPANAPGVVPGPWEQPPVTWSTPQTSRPPPISAPVSRSRTAQTPGSLWAARASPRAAPCLPCLPAPGPLGRLRSRQAQTPPPAGGEAGTPGCWKQCARPNSWHCRPHRRLAPAPGVRPYRWAGRGNGCSQRPSGFSPRQVCVSSSDPACGRPALPALECSWPQNTGPTPNFPTPQ